MAAIDFQPRNDRYRQLIGNGISYRVPPFQRDYSWGEDEWDDLWQDIVETIHMGGEETHYMGYLVLQSTGDRTLNIIDGQQRLTTLSIVVLAGLKHLQRLVRAGVDAKSNEARLDQIRGTYIGERDAVTLNVIPKLTLNRHNNRYFQDQLIRLADHLPQRGYNVSERAMRAAFIWFDRMLGEWLKGRDDKGAAIATFVDEMSHRLFFTVITVTDELNAYRVFETLNARGVQLSSTDLLKNYLFTILDRANVHQRELDRLEDRWAALVDRLGDERFSNYLRVFWNSRRPGRVRETGLFRVVRDAVRTAPAVFTLVDDMEADLETYLLLVNEPASGVSHEVAGTIRELQLFRVRQPLAMLLAARRVLSDDEFARVLRAVAVISLRYNVIGSLATGDQETLYIDVVGRIIRGEFSTARALIDAFAPVYVADDQFKATFAQRAINTRHGTGRKLVRHLLTRIERQVSGNVQDEQTPVYSIEHVLPERPGDGWNHFSDQDAAEYVYRLGNMTMLETGLNRDLGNAEYPEKRMAYEDSRFAITRRIAEHNDTWTPQRIDAHQNWLAQQATAVWRVAELSDRNR